MSSREGSAAAGPSAYVGAYQAWSAPQCGQLTLVDTGASNRQPHAHV